jgi:GNAT superfamily N-acetyltransferase
MESRAFSFKPLTPERWSDFETLFGPHGACGGCWCMYWLVSGAEFKRQQGQGNKQAMQGIVLSGKTPGILAYSGGKPVGWCALAPRPVYTKLERSRILKPVDDQPVWSVVCFFVEKPFRLQGLTVELLNAAVQFAAANGASIVEGYPVEPKESTMFHRKMPDAFVYMGLASAFKQAGFVEEARRSETRPVMRRYILEKSE